MTDNLVTDEPTDDQPEIVHDERLGQRIRDFISHAESFEEHEVEQVWEAIKRLWNKIV